MASRIFWFCGACETGGGLEVSLVSVPTDMSGPFIKETGLTSEGVQCPHTLQYLAAQEREVPGRLPSVCVIERPLSLSEPAERRGVGMCVCVCVSGLSLSELASWGSSEAPD